MVNDGMTSQHDTDSRAHVFTAIKAFDNQEAHKGAFQALSSPSPSRIPSQTRLRN